MSQAEKDLRIFLFEQAVKRDYCNIYSNHDIVEAALQQVVDDMKLKGRT